MKGCPVNCIGHEVRSDCEFCDGVELTEEDWQAIHKEDEEWALNLEIQAEKDWQGRGES
jgi:hypothetical protein